MEFNEMFEIEESKDIDHNKVTQPQNVIKHCVIRILLLPIVVGITILITYLIGGDYGILAGIYFSAIIFVLWKLYLLVESLVLFTKNKKKLAQSNLYIFLITFFFAVIIALQID